jgi:ABC-type molybdenum transport system ATPase subunit/photorepair protein PhrA
MKTRLRVLLITTRAEDLPATVTHVLEVSGCTIKHCRPSGRKIGFPREAEAEGRMVPGRAGSPVPHSPIHNGGQGTDRPTTGQSPGSLLNSAFRAAVGAKALARRPRPLIEFRNVSVAYGTKRVLENVNWTVYAGESWALLGPNGSGKSTLLSLITGDHPQVYSNEIHVLGTRRGSGESIWELKRQIGYVSPELHVHFDESVSCLNVVASGFAGTIGVFDPPALRELRAARRALECFGLQEAAATPLFGLSTGLQRMVLLARALVNKPRLLLLDEPCQGLDCEHRRAFVSRVDHLIQQGEATVVYVTHRRDELPGSLRRVFRLGPSPS